MTNATNATTKVPVSEYVLLKTRQGLFIKMLKVDYEDPTFTTVYGIKDYTWHLYNKAELTIASKLEILLFLHD